MQVKLKFTDTGSKNKIIKYDYVESEASAWDGYTYDCRMSSESDKNCNKNVYNFSRWAIESEGVSSSAAAKPSVLAKAADVAKATAIAETTSTLSGNWSQPSNKCSQ